MSCQAQQPCGPWTGPTLAYRTPETTDQIYIYNAKPQAQPRLWTGRSGNLRISYCVNNYNPGQLDLRTYRWHWLRVPMEMLAAAHRHYQPSPDQEAQV